MGSHIQLNLAIQVICLITFIRGFIPGQWRVNIHWYNRKDQETAEIPVLIELYDNKPNFKLLASQEVLLTKRGQQATAFNFTMDEEGKIFDVNYEHLVGRPLTRYYFRA